MVRCMWSVIAFLLVCLPGVSEEVIVRSPGGEYFSVEVDTARSFQEVAQQIGQTFSSEGYVFDCGAYYRGPKTGREYWREVTSEEKKELRYIITTLAKSGWLDLLSKKDSMERAGDKIDHLHPLRFLMAIFTDEEMKDCVHAIRDRTLVWSEFIDPTCKTLEEEANHDNVKKEFVKDFAKRVKVDANLLIPMAQARQWNEIVDTLLKKLPRQGNPDRYDQ